MDTKRNSQTFFTMSDFLKPGIDMLASLNTIGVIEKGLVYFQVMTCPIYILKIN